MHLISKTKIEKRILQKFCVKINISKKNMLYNNDFSDLRLTDEEDFNLIKNITNISTKKNMDFSLEDILKYKSNNPEIFNINKHKKKYGFKIKFWSKKMDNCRKYYSWWKYAFIKKT